MSWLNGECDEHGPLVDGACPECPTEEQMIEDGDFYGVADRILDLHEGHATRASYLGEAMGRCYAAGRRDARNEGNADET